MSETLVALATSTILVVALAVARELRVRRSARAEAPTTYLGSRRRRRLTPRLPTLRRRRPRTSAALVARTERLRVLDERIARLETYLADLEGETRRREAELVRLEGVLPDLGRGDRSASRDRAEEVPSRELVPFREAAVRTTPGRPVPPPAIEPAHAPVRDLLRDYRDASTKRPALPVVRLRHAAQSRPKPGGQEDSWHARRQLVVVADGVGGHRDGDKASAIVTRVFGNADADAISLDASDVERSLRARAIAAQRELRTLAGADTGNAPATTVVAVTVSVLEGKPALTVLSVGDSRAWLVPVGAGASPIPLTYPHSSGGRLTRALGLLGEGRAEPEVSTVPVSDGDVVVLATDGLWRVREDADAIVAEAAAPGWREPDALLQHLFLRARLVGEVPPDDDVTVVVARVEIADVPALVPLG